MHPRCRQAPPWLARPFSEVHCQSRGPGGYPGRTDRRQGHALRAPDSELTTSVPVPSMRVPPHWASSEEAVMQYARIQVLPDIPPGGVCAGIDWASKDHVACVVDMAGRVTDRFSAAHDKAGIAGMIARLRRSGAAEVAIERSDGVLVGALLAAGLTVVVITSRQVRNLRSRYGAAGGKDDRFDSYVLADTLRTDRARLRPLAADTPATIALRSAVRARKDLVAHRVVAANQLRAHLAVAFPAAVGLFSELDSVLSLAFLARFGSQDAAAGLAAALAGLAAQIKALETQIAGQLAAHPDSHIFTSLPRAGTLRAARLLAEIGDCRSRFPDPWSLAALAGTAPVTRRSGTHISHTFRWAVSHQLRDAVCDFAGDSRHANPWAAAIYHDARDRGKDHPHAVRITARAWIYVIWRCWQDGTAYDPAKHNAFQAILARKAAAAGDGQGQ